MRHHFYDTKVEPASTPGESTDVECIDCHELFHLSRSEQAWFAERSMMPPKRCKNCRHEKRLRNDAHFGATMQR